jgi:hypothetical protein
MNGIATIAHYAQSATPIGAEGNGTLEVTSAMTWDGGFISSQALSVTIGPAATLDIQGTGTRIVGVGGLFVEGTAKWLSVTLQLNGAMEIASSGEFVIQSDAIMSGSGTLINEGTIAKQVATGTTVIGPAAVNNNAGTLVVEEGILMFSGNLEIPNARVRVSGTNPGTEYGQIQVVGQVIMSGGELEIELDAEPVLNDRFTVLTYGSGGGEFASYTYSGTSIPTGLSIQPDYTSSALDLVVVADP